ncbi:FKBP-type peptidyl-prolyl cis-trans isomerase [Candidatus Saccharibacteria bacterium]|nr:FKBP-type peptidyl-prolyl cis-trans isomerase [Candidatus Saccharibacteria bacterium]MBI3338069.1 FKBP-type peptidyl-prolyl cis-trans isomerase [Candidatus Saccharibacteria bacterium]
MAKTKPYERIFALTAALVFLTTTVAISLVVVWQARQDNKDSQTAISQQGSLKEAKLEGTKLAGFTPIDKVEQLQISDLQVGTGAEVKEGATVTAHYTGALAKNGTIFQSSHDGANQPVEFPLNGVIAGWTKGVPGMKVGGTRRLIIPASLAYGESSPSANIPPNSDLVFDIELTAIKN